MDYPSQYKSQQEWFDTEQKYGYDMAGYVKKYGIPDQSGGKHLTDEFKLPHHMTFSTDSQYSGGEAIGGNWKQDANKKWHFFASEFNLSQHSPEELQNYFKTYEKDSVLHLPKGNILQQIEDMNKAVK
jgi:hypothetical protein